MQPKRWRPPGGSGMPFDPRVIRPAPLTFPIGPYPDETYLGFLNRLARANQLDHGGPLQQIIRSSGMSSLDGLAALTARSPLTVALAIPTIPNGFTDPRLRGRPSRLRRFACRRCAVRRTGRNVFVYAHQWDVICHRHQRWLAGSRQFDVAALPHLAGASRRHRLLTTQYGHAATYEAWKASQGVLMAYSRNGTPMPSRARDAYAMLTDQQADRAHDGDAFNVATYPVAIQIAALLLDPSRTDADGPGNTQKMTASIREWVPLLGARHDMTWRDPLRVTLRQHRPPSSETYMT